ncbi:MULTISPECIES: hypothetical protein [Yersiniaceae]|uniref:Uncharacterized protein n=1 Tax=Nissabacter archeti TaxID=1917880 RepID=A0ABS5JJ61_9GAMM|nr:MULTISPECIES: hypothetical protein [Yersiniaceae]MBS0970018.1 hypothetical protein [Nissabacter archeti]MDV5140052.1 hypothetical protein [Chimaeribacter arupi]WKZ90927.1 hypothetical protein P0E69_11755 [Chimaeribacter arupi]
MAATARLSGVCPVHPRSEKSISPAGCEFNKYEMMFYLFFEGRHAFAIFALTPQPEPVV